MTINNATITDNDAIFGGGVFNVVGGGGKVYFSNTIIGDNDPGGDCFGDPFDSLGYNLDSDATCSLVAAGDLSGVEPLFGPLQDNGGPTLTHALTAGSPAVNAGNPSIPGSGGAACESTDQRGVFRPQLSACDIGSYEATLTAFGVPVPGIRRNRIGSGFGAGHFLCAGPQAPLGSSDVTAPLAQARVRGGEGGGANSLSNGDL